MSLQKNNNMNNFTAHLLHRSLMAAALLLASSTAWAIPSPDLVINLSASIAQLFGLLSVVFGGFAMSKGKKGKNKKGGLGKSGKYLLGILGVALVGSLAANALQYTGTVDATNKRMQTNLVRKSVENGSTVGDVSLKTLSFSDQKIHPLGMTTDDVSALLAQGKTLNIIDVREEEEFEIGSFKEAQHRRYPDVLAEASLVPADQHTLFLCYSGNRSSELCIDFHKQGKSCNFMVGGFEKWMSESRPMATNSTASEFTAEQLRTLPDFPNKDLLLETTEVERLVLEEDAQFVDVRYPADFATGHLPGATNITMRALPTAALEVAINAIPDKPIVAACYDKRSCFYSTLIGLRMHRAGKDFRGRYSVPHEFYIPSNKQRAHVAAWTQSQQSPTLASYVVTPLRAVLNKAVDISGHYIWGLLAVVLMIRLALLPLALKAERDTQVQASLKGRIATLREELAEHPRAMSDATLALFKRYNIRPVINMLASIFQLTLMLLFYSAVDQSAAGWGDAVFWLPENSAANPDPLWVLPTLAAGLFLGVLLLQSPVRSIKKGVFYAAAGAGLFFLLQALGAAVNMYLAISMAFLIGQTLFFKWLGNHLGWSTMGEDKTDTVEDDGLVPLSKAHYLPQSTGKKAARLGQLIEAGYDVPGGFVFTSVINENGNKDKLLNAEQTKRLKRMWKALKTDVVAVRSSGANEDGADTSFAGVYDSILNVSRDELVGAVRDVYSSLYSDRSSDYTRHSSGGDEQERDQGGVVVQKMIPAEFAGVMFTEHPATTGAMLVELVSGLGEELVSGNVTPDTHAFGKLTDNWMVEESSTDIAPPVDMAPLLKMGRELEVMFDHPQDIEWAYAKGKFYLLQARNITRSVASGTSLKNLGEEERRKLLHAAGQIVKFDSKKKKQKAKQAAQSDKPMFVQNELSELLPRPTPFSADLMSKLWEAGGSTDLACQELGIPYDVNYFSVPYITTIFGWTYVNKVEEQRRLGKGPGAMAAFQLSRNADQIEANFREGFLPDFQQEMIERNAINVDALSLAVNTDLLHKWVKRFVEDTYQQAELINISADYYNKTAMDKLKAAKLEPTKYMNAGDETVVSEAMALLQNDPVTEAHIEEFLLTFGHRAPLDYELSGPRFNEDRKLVDQYIERSGKAAPAEHGEAVALPDKKILAISVDRARRFQCLKEEAKHYCLLELALIRRLMLCIDRQAGLDGRAFQLTIAEATELGNQAKVSELQALADSRHAASVSWQGMQLPSSLSIADLENIDMLTGKRKDGGTVTDMTGKRVAGEQEVTGVIRVITDIADIDSFQKGEILVARMTDPTWYPLFSQANGIVTEVGGWLSHAAIVAREYDLPAIVGVQGICNTLNTGDIVTLKLDGTVERVEERRDDDSPMRDSSVPVTNSSSATIETIAKVYQLTAVRMRRLRKQVDRREHKARLGDRRQAPRVSASGEAQPDRRAANRAENRQSMIEGMRKAS